MPPRETPPDAELLVVYRQFPFCSPSLARGRQAGLRTPADRAKRVRVEFETVLHGRAWYDRERWFDTMDRAPIAPTPTMRFSHDDQVIQAAIEGSGVAIGKWPHLATHLLEGTLVLPFGHDCVVVGGAFHLVFARTPGAGDAVQPFADWLRDEVYRDAASAPALPGLEPPPRNAARAARRR